MFGVCRFCKNEADLCKSHAIPNGFFRPILRSSNGSMIVLPGDDSKVSGTSDTGADRLLCGECEARFNQSWDSPLVRGLRQFDQLIQTDGFSAVFEYDHNELAQSLASVLWRSCESGATLYAASPTIHPLTAELTSILQLPSSKTLERLSISIRRLWDPTPSENGGIGQSIIWQIVIPPTMKRLRIKGRDTGFGFYSAFQGFLIEMTWPKLPYMVRNKPFYLKKNGRTIRACRVNILDYPPTRQMMVHAIQKHVTGNTTSRARK